MKILGQRIKVEYTKSLPWTADGMGRADEKAGVIAIDKTMPKDQRDFILLHEIIHMISFMLKFDLTEQQVNGLAVGLLPVVRKWNRKNKQ